MSAVAHDDGDFEAAYVVGEMPTSFNSAIKPATRSNGRKHAILNSISFVRTRYGSLCFYLRVRKLSAVGVFSESRGIKLER